MPLWNLFSSLLWDPTLSWLLPPWFLLLCLLCWFFLGCSAYQPWVILGFCPMFSSPYPPSPLWALHQLVTSNAFHMLMAPKCTFQPGPCPELQARISNCLFTPLSLRSWLPASLLPFLSSSLTPSSLSFFLPQITYYLCNLFTQAHVCVCETAWQRRAVHNREQFHTLQKSFAKAFLEMLHSPRAYRKRFWFVNPFLLCLNATLKNMLNFCFKFCPIQPLFSQVLTKSWVLRLVLQGNRDE